MVQFNGAPLDMDACVLSPPPASLLGRLAGLLLAVVAPLLVACLPALWCVCYASKRVSSWLASKFIPVAMAKMDKTFEVARTILLERATGKVLDVGCGSGIYLKYYRNPKVTSVTLLEPNSNIHPLLRANVEKAGLSVPVEIVSCFLDDLPDAPTYDTIVLGNCMCEIPEPIPFVKDCYDRLKDGGVLFFQEHVLDDDNGFRRALQRLWNPIWSVISDGCNCDRPTLHTIRTMPWKELVHKTFRDPNAPPFVTRQEVGLALK